MDGPEFFEQLRVEVCRAEEEMASYIQRYVLMWCTSYILVFHAPRSKGAHVLVVYCLGCPEDGGENGMGVLILPALTYL